MLRYENASSCDDYMRDERLLIPYRLRVVRVGIQATWLTVAILLAYALLADDTEVRRAEMFAVTAAGALGAILVSLLRWRDLFDRGIGVTALTVWSIFDIGLISVGVWASGGVSSPVFIGFALTTLFFALAYPVRSQILLLGCTYLGYGIAGWIEGGPVPEGTVIIRLGGLAVFAMMAARIGSELLRQVTAHADARVESDRRAGLLSVVAETAQDLTSAAPEKVLDLVSAAVGKLGFDVAAVSLLEASGVMYQVVSATGLPEAFLGGKHNASEGLTGVTIRAGHTIVVDDYSNHPLAIKPLRKERLRASVATPIVAEGRTVAVLIGASRTDRRLASGEVEVFELLAGLAGRVFESARRLETEHRAVERLEELDRLKTDFLTTVSHEIRTPLTAIQGMGLTLGTRWDEIDDDLRRELVARLNANTRVLNDVITSLLDFSRVEAGRLEVKADRTDVGALVAAVMDRLSMLFAEHDVDVRVEKGLAAQADPILLERVVENLAANAVKHTPTGTTVVVSARRVGDEVEVRVADGGAGIPEDEMMHLGERFFRGGASSSPRARGTGLGLALVTEVLRLHGSKLEVESKVGKGTAFWFRLPLMDDSARG